MRRRLGLVEVLPTACAVERTHANRPQQRRIEHPDVDLPLARGLAGHRLDVGDAAADAAAHEAARPIAPLVRAGDIGVAVDAHRLGRVESPQRAEPAADRAVAGRDGLRRGRNLDLDRTAVASG